MHSFTHKFESICNRIMYPHHARSMHTHTTRVGTDLVYKPYIFIIHLKTYLYAIVATIGGIESSGKIPVAGGFHVL